MSTSLPGDFTDDIDDSDEIIAELIKTETKRLKRKLTEEEKRAIEKMIKNPD